MRGPYEITYPNSQTNKGPKIVNGSLPIDPLQPELDKLVQEISRDSFEYGMGCACQKHLLPILQELHALRAATRMQSK